jgi:uridine kinase
MGKFISERSCLLLAARYYKVRFSPFCKQPQRTGRDAVFRIIEQQISKSAPNASFFIALTGDVSSGKSYTTKELGRHLKAVTAKEIVTISVDDWLIPYDEREADNISKDLDAINRELASLMDGKTIYKPIFDKGVYQRERYEENLEGSEEARAEGKRFVQAPFLAEKLSQKYGRKFQAENVFVDINTKEVFERIGEQPAIYIIDGGRILHDPRINRHYDLRLCLDVPVTVRRQRFIERHQRREQVVRHSLTHSLARFNRRENKVAYQYRHLLNQQRADIIITHG